MLIRRTEWKLYFPDPLLVNGFKNGNTNNRIGFGAVVKI